jgi:hypothetical protein
MFEALRQMVQTQRQCKWRANRARAGLVTGQANQNEEQAALDLERGVPRVRAGNVY